MSEIVAQIQSLVDENGVLKIQNKLLEEELKKTKSKNRDLIKWNKNKQNQISDLQNQVTILERRLKLNQTKKDIQSV